jgi:hypothetical protein
MVLTISAQANEGRCAIHLDWKPADGAQPALLDGKATLAKELSYIQELVSSIGGELSLSDGQSEILLKVPAAIQTRPEIVH